MLLAACVVGTDAGLKLLESYGVVAAVNHNSASVVEEVMLVLVLLLSLSTDGETW